MRTALFVIAGASIGLGVFLIVPVVPGGPGTTSAIIGYVVFGRGVAIRLLVPRGASPFGNAAVITPGRSGQAAAERVVGRRVQMPGGPGPTPAATRATVLGAWPTGQRAGDISPGLSGPVGAEPVMRIDLVYRSHAGVDVNATTVAIVPAHRMDALAPGAHEPVRYLLDQPRVVSLDRGAP